MVSTFASQQFKTTNQLGPVSVESDLPRPAWVLSGGSGFPQSKDIWGTELERPKEAAAQVSWGGSTRWVVHSEQWTPGKQLDQMAWQGGSSESVQTSCPWSSLRSSSPSSLSQAFMPLWLKPATIVPLPTKTNNREPQHLLTLCSDPYYNECFGMFWLYATLPPKFDPLQFAHRANRATAHIIVTVLHTNMSCLEQHNSIGKGIFASEENWLID